MQKEVSYQYDEVDFRERMRLLMQLFLKEETSKNGNAIVFLVMSSLLGFIFLYFNSEGPGIVIGPILLMVAAIAAIALIQFYQRKRRAEREFDQTFDPTIERLNETDGMIWFLFSDEYFGYRDGDQEIKLRWNLMHSYLIKGKYLYLMSEDGSSKVYTLSASDISQTDFDEICEFVRTKLPAHALSKLELKEKRKNSEILDD